jgi:hypothetical protein
LTAPTIAIAKANITGSASGSCTSGDITTLKNELAGSVIDSSITF